MSKFYIFNKTKYAVAIRDIKRRTPNGDYGNPKLFVNDYTVIDDSDCIPNYTVSMSVGNGILKELKTTGKVDVFSEYEYYESKKHKRISDAGGESFGSVSGVAGGILQAAKSVKEEVLNPNIVDLTQLIEDSREQVSLDFEERLKKLELAVQKLGSATKSKVRAKSKNKISKKRVIGKKR